MSYTKWGPKMRRIHHHEAFERMMRHAKRRGYFDELAMRAEIIIAQRNASMAMHVAEMEQKLRALFGGEGTS